ncbi:MAG: mechanosensitive ion channel [Fimbriimonadaceae bacterium]|nr:mechanosensitive ion channel [Fimbriimonadaceae bacterium]
MTWQEIETWANQPLINIQGLELSVGILIKSVLLLVLVIVGSKLVRRVARKALTRLPNVDTSTADSIASLVYYALLALGLAWALSTVGFDATSLAVFTGALGLGVGLGFQEIAKNFISGIIMLINKTIKVGDVISVNDLTGKVEEVGMYSSRMRTVLDATVIIPNSQILNDQFVNWTHDRPIRMVEIPIGVHYESDLDEVMNILHESVREIEHLLAEPPARVLLLNYGNSSVDFAVRVWTDEVMYFQRVISVYNLEVWRRFKKSGVVIPYPQQDVYVKEWPGKQSE